MRVWRVGSVVLLALLLAPALTLTTARLLDPSATLVVQLQAFAPLALPLYAAVLVPTLAVATVAWWRRRTVRAVPAFVAFLATLGLLLHGAWLAPLFVGDRPPADRRDPLTVMSANILRARTDPAELVAAVRARDADVLVLIEVRPRDVEALVAAGLQDLLPHTLARRPRDTTVFARRPVRLVDVVATRAASLVVEVGVVRLLAVHPVPPLEVDTWRHEHAVLLDATREFRPDLIAGDFNATADHRPMRRYGDLGYRDAAELSNAGFQPTWPTRRVPRQPSPPAFLGPLATIDHVLVGRRWTALDAAVHELGGTDHRYVVARVAPRAL